MIYNFSYLVQPAFRTQSLEIKFHETAQSSFTNFTKP